MPLTLEVRKKILDLVKQQPRSVDEVARHINKNWRTANSYIEILEKETGQIKTKVFRGGTRGALKVVYWEHLESLWSEEFQERLFRKIEIANKKTDFSPFEIYQYVGRDKKTAFISHADDEKSFERIARFIEHAEKEILSFSGNLSWINFRYKGKSMRDIMEDAAKRNVFIQVLTRVDIAGLENIRKLLEINAKLGKRLIEIRHCEQPLRGFVIDDKIARFKEVKDPEDYLTGELSRKTVLFYEIYDSDWIDWLKKVFLKLFRQSISAERRLEDIEKIKRL